MKDPYCCLSEKIRAALDGFDHGALTTYRSLRYAVAQLSREDALELIDSQIADLEGQVTYPAKYPQVASTSPKCRAASSIQEC